MAKRIDLSSISTKAPDKLDKEEIKAETLKMRQKIYQYQRMMYAQNKYSLLVVLQGLDAAGKNSVVKRIFSGVNPLGCKVYGFVKPTNNEYAHDFLWRIHKVTPPTGMIYIYNRSHYEDILVPTVEKTFPPEVIEKRYKHINNFEELLTDSNTHILKFYLHISPDEQKERLEERLNEKRSYRKHNDGDWRSRQKWDEYIKVYQDIFEKTSKRHAPWFVIPGDNKWYTAYLITKEILKVLEQKMELDWPDLDTEMFDDEEK